MNLNKDVYLRTQTWSYRAINIYKKQDLTLPQNVGLGGILNTQKFFE